MTNIQVYNACASSVLKEECINNLVALRHILNDTNMTQTAVKACEVDLNLVVKTKTLEETFEKVRKLNMLHKSPLALWEADHDVCLDWNCSSSIVKSSACMGNKHSDAESINSLPVFRTQNDRSCTTSIYIEALSMLPAKSRSCSASKSLS